jgi:tetratricopeptide (TPR) repeat protein
MARLRFPSLRFNAARVAFILCSVAAVSSWAQAPVRPELDKDLLTGKWEAVVSRFDSAAPQNTVEKFIFAHACLAVNRNNEAVDLFLSQTDQAETGAWVDWSRNLASTNPGNAVAHYFYGDALSRSGQIEDGIHEFDKGLAASPKDAVLLNARGVAHAALGDTVAAARDFDAARRSQPSLADVYANLGSLGIQRKRGSKGVSAAFEAALKLSPSFAIPLVGQGLLRTNGWPGSNSSPSYTAKEQLQDARSDFDAAMRGSGVLKAEVARRVSETVTAAEKEEQERVTIALAVGDPGTLIQRNLEALNNGGTNMGAAVENLMGLAVRFPDRTQEISSNIASVKGDAGSAMEQYRLMTSHMEALDNLASSTLASSFASAPRTLGQSNFLGQIDTSRMHLFDASAKPTWSNIADTLDSSKATLNAFSDLLKLSAAKPFASATGGSNRYGGLIPGLDSAGHLFSLGSAAANDFGAMSDGSFNLFSSHLLDQSASLGLQSFTKYLSGSGGKTLPDYFKGIDKAAGPLTSFAEAFGSNLGSGRLDSDTASKYGDAIGQTMLWNAQMQSGSRYLFRPGLVGAGFASAVSSDLFAFAASRAESGNLFDFHSLTVSEADHLGDAAVGAAFFGLGMALTCPAGRILGGNSNVGSISADFGRYAKKTLEDMTMPVYASFELPNLNRQLRALGQPEITNQQFVAQMRSVSSPPERPDVDLTTMRTQESYRIETQAGITKITQFDPSGLATRSTILDNIHFQTTDPGGFKTTTNKPLWDDGKWPFTPWYALGYPMRPAASSLPNQ